MIYIQCETLVRSPHVCFAKLRAPLLLRKKRTNLDTHPTFEIVYILKLHYIRCVFELVWTFNYSGIGDQNMLKWIKSVEVERFFFLQNISISCMAYQNPMYDQTDPY